VGAPVGTPTNWSTSCAPRGDPLSLGKAVGGGELAGEISVFGGGEMGVGGEIGREFSLPSFASIVWDPPPPMARALNAHRAVAGPFPLPMWGQCVGGCAASGASEGSRWQILGTTEKRNEH